MNELFWKNINKIKRICKGFLPTLGDDDLFDDYVQSVTLMNLKTLNKKELDTAFIKRDILDVFRSKFYKHRKLNINIDYLINDSKLSYSTDLDLKIDVKNSFNKLTKGNDHD